ncbi:MAG: 50S ribosomal protein L25 [Dehalococcoidia bacterium]
MPDTYAAEPRALLGKSVARLRRQGVLPANIYGRGVTSTAVQIATRDVRTLLQAHGLNTLVNLQVSGEGQPRSVVVRKVQRHPVSRQLEHVDFYQVDLARPIQGPVPVVLIGEAPAVHTYRALLLQSVDAVVVEALPAQMPSSIELSIDGMRAPDATVTVGDIDPPPGVTIVTAPDVVIAAISRARGSGSAGEALPEGEQEEPIEGEAGSEAEAEAENEDAAADAADAE